LRSEPCALVVLSIGEAERLSIDTRFWITSGNDQSPVTDPGPRITIDIGGMDSIAAADTIEASLLQVISATYDTYLVLTRADQLRQLYSFALLNELPDITVSIPGRTWSESRQVSMKQLVMDSVTSALESVCGRAPQLGLECLSGITANLHSIGATAQARELAWQSVKYFPAARAQSGYQSVDETIEARKTYLLELDWAGVANPVQENLSGVFGIVPLDAVRPVTDTDHLRRMRDLTYRLNGRDSE
jgi:hypothetical protein